MKPTNPIIFFDGVCNLCNAYIDKVIQYDREGIFKLASLQGAAAQKLLPAVLYDNLGSIVVLTEEGQVLLQSDAIIWIMKNLPQTHIRLLAMLSILIPRGLRNFVYQSIANNRYKIWGKRETCRIPTENEKKRFLE